MSATASMVDLEALRRFLLEANAAGYAGGEEKEWTREPDYSWTIVFQKGDWKSHDNFFGGEPYGGRTVVSHREKPVWMMIYYGWVAPASDANAAYAFLRKALREMPESHPFRGPEMYESNDLSYANAWEGDLVRFSGREAIARGASEIYAASYFGGLVDQRQAT